MTASAMGTVTQNTLLIHLESYLDKASKRMLRSRRKENPDLTYDEFFRSFCREMTPGPNVQQKINGTKQSWFEKGIN